MNSSHIMTLANTPTFALQSSRTLPMQHVCPVRTCNKSFSTSGNLSRHKRLHGYIEPLPCPVAGCVCTFTSNNKLAKHMRFHFGSDDVKVCVVSGCGKTFSTTGNLNRHLKAAHGCDSDASSSGSNTPRSECCSPLWSGRPSLCASGSPTGADQWFVHDAQLMEDTTWALAPIAFAAPQAVDDWDSDLVDALSVLFDIDEPEALSSDCSEAN